MVPKTLDRLPDHALSRFPREDAFAWRDGPRFRSISTAEFARQVRHTTLGLLDQGIGPGDRVAILAGNRIEWAIVDLALLAAGAVDVPLFETLPAGAIHHILEDARVSAIVISHTTALEKVRAVESRLSRPLRIFLMDATSGRQDAVVTMAEIEARGRELAGRIIAPIDSPDPEDTATIIYTSGTTGTPCGVPLTHRNLLSNMASVLGRIPVGPSDEVLSFLPLGHIFERMAGFYSMLAVGARISYASSPGTVAEDIRSVRPTLLITVPRFLEKARDSILSAADESGRVGRWVFRRAIRAGHHRFGAGAPPVAGRGGIEARIADRLVFARIRARLGGRLRFMISGGAPLPEEVNRFFHTVGIPVYEGYGLTEASPVLAVNAPGACRIGTAGRAVPGVDLKIAGDGEILARGPNVMRGYLGREGESRAALAGGWLHTGDLGTIDAEGYLRITGRKKDIIVLSTGKNIAPRPIEARLRQSPWIREVVLVGNGRKYLTALILPPPDRISRAGGIAASDVPEPATPALLHDPALRSSIAGEIRRLARPATPHERIRRFLLIGREFRIADGLLTPTLKICRPRVESFYRDAIDDLYR